MFLWFLLIHDTFSFYIRTMLVDQMVYITIVNFNMRRTTIDIDEQFYPLSTKAEILIESTPNRWLNSTSKSSNLKDQPRSVSNDIYLNHIELNPFQSLLLRVDPTENAKHGWNNPWMTNGRVVDLSPFSLSDIIYLWDWIQLDATKWSILAI